MRTIIFALLYCLTCSTQAQVTLDIADDVFVIQIDTQGNTMTLTCEQGCNWTTLKLTGNRYTPHIINRLGKEDQFETTHKDTYGSFVVSIMRTNDGVSIRGINDTAFEELRVSGKESRRFKINQNGMM
jgi:hypothetical protein